MVLKGQIAYSSKDYTNAGHWLSNALVRIGSEPSAGGLKVYAEGLLDETNRQITEQRARQSAGERYAAFMKRHDDAMFRGTFLTELGLPAQLEDLLAARDVQEAMERAKALCTVGKTSR